MRKFVVGDIRGDLGLLKKLFDKIGFGESDSVVFLGSYMGPGSDSKGTVDFVLDLKNKYPGKVSCLEGCYEYLFKFCVGETPSISHAALWSHMGGKKVFSSYAAKDVSIHVLRTGNNGHPTPVKEEIPLQVPITHIRFIDGLSQWYEDNVFPYVATHAGGHPILFGGRLETEDQVVFAENDWWKKSWKQIPNKTIIFSHVTFKKPFRGPGKLGIDLGAGLGGKLCAFELFSESFTIVE